MSVFIHRDKTVMRLAAEHGNFIRQAVDNINTIIQNARELPIRFSGKLLGDIPVVRQELVRKLEKESGWIVAIIHDTGEADDYGTVELRSIYS